MGEPRETTTVNLEDKAMGDPFPTLSQNVIYCDHNAADCAALVIAIDPQHSRKVRLVVWDMFGAQSIVRDVMQDENRSLGTWRTVWYEGIEEAVS